MGLVHCNRLRNVGANKSHCLGGDGVAPDVSDDAVDLTACSALDHHIVIGIVLHAGGVPDIGACVLEVPLIPQAVTLGLHGDAVVFAHSGGCIGGLGHDRQNLVGNGGDGCDLGFHALAPHIGDDALDLTVVSCPGHHIVVGVVPLTGNIPGLGTDLPPVPLIPQLVALGLHSDAEHFTHLDGFIFGLGGNGQLMSGSRQDNDDGIGLHGVAPGIGDDAVQFPVVSCLGHHIVIAVVALTGGIPNLGACRTEVPLILQAITLGIKGNIEHIANGHGLVLGLPGDCQRGGGGTGDGGDLGGDAVAPGIGDHAVDLTVMSCAGHHIVIGIVPLTGNSPVFVADLAPVPLIFQAVSFSEDFHAEHLIQLCGGIIGLPGDCQLRGLDSDQGCGVGGDGVAVCIGDDAVDLAACSCGGHHIVIGIVGDGGLVPDIGSGIAEVPLILQSLALGDDFHAVAFAQLGFAVRGLLGDDGAGGLDGIVAAFFAAGIVQGPDGLAVFIHSSIFNLQLFFAVYIDGEAAFAVIAALDPLEFVGCGAVIIQKYGVVRHATVNRSSFLKNAVLINLDGGAVPAVGELVGQIHRDLPVGIGNRSDIGQVDAGADTGCRTVVAVHDFDTVVIPKLGIHVGEIRCGRIGGGVSLPAPGIHENGQTGTEIQYIIAT